MVIGRRLILVRILLFPAVAPIGIAVMIRTTILNGGRTTPFISALEIASWALPCLCIAVLTWLDWKWRRQARTALAGHPHPCPDCFGPLLPEGPRLLCTSCGYYANSLATFERDWGWARLEGAKWMKEPPGGSPAGPVVGKRLTKLMLIGIALNVTLGMAAILFSLGITRTYGTNVPTGLLVGIHVLRCLAALGAVIPVWMYWSLFRRARADVKPRTYACARCFYPFKGSEEPMLCTECGYEAPSRVQLKMDWGPAWPRGAWGP